MPVVITMGTFDTLHPGHVELLRQCRRIAGDDGVVVATANSDNFVRAFKHRSPSQTEEERLTMLKACRYVDEAYVFDGPDAKPTIEAVDPDFIVIGSDWAGRNYHEQLQVNSDWLAERDISILYLDRWSPYSSTELKERIRGT